MSASQHDAAPEFARAMGPVARELLGEPNPAQSSTVELRWGTRGSMSVRLDKGTWFDNEAGQGGGVLDLVQQRQQLDKPGAVAWMRERGHLDPAHTGQRREVATYPYHDEHGALLFEVVRFEPKDFRQRRPDGQGWTWNTKGVRRVVFRLPDVLAAVAAGRTIYVVEGEKSALALVALGLDATCSPGGAGKWRAEYSKALTGADVVILPDNDAPGQQHASSVATSLAGIARAVRVLELPGLPDKGDVVDWIAAGGTWRRLEELADDAALEHTTDRPLTDTAATPLWIESAAWIPEEIPPRPWLASGYFLRGHVTTIVGPGGVSKSSLVLAYVVALALQRDVHGMRPLGPFRSAVFNAEDDQDEQRRRLTAILGNMGQEPASIANMVHRVGPNAVGTLLERDPDSGAPIPTEAMRQLERELVSSRVDILFVDPLVEAHGMDENDNTAMRAIVAAFRTLAKRCDIAVVLVHHTRKGAAIAGDAEAGRGASSVIGASRVVLTLAGMTPEEAKAFGLPEDTRSRYFRVDGGKANYSTLTGCEWFERITRMLPNDDAVAVPVPWTPPQDAVTPDVRAKVEAAIAIGSTVGPLSPKLENRPRSVKHAMVNAGITTLPGQKDLLAELLADGFTIGLFEDGNRRWVQGLRTPAGEPLSAHWKPDDGTDNSASNSA